MADLSIPNAHARNIEAAPTAENLITTHLDIWTTAIEQKSSAGRGSSNKFSLYGIKKLRELILELAVRGKLVPQDPNDEPASVLLERIAAEKAQLVKEGKLKKQKPLPEISEDEKPFELPQGWEWSGFDYLPLGYSVGLDRGKSQQGPDNKFRYFKMNNISNEGGFDLKNVVFVDASDEEVEQYTLKDYDLLFNTRNSKELVGKTCVYVSDSPEPILYNNNILRACFSENKLSFILDIWMRSPTGKLELEKIKSGTTNVWAIYQGKLALLHCIIPPLEEQHRIVAKVDELMSLCDALEAQTEASISAHQTLVETLLNALLLPQATANTASQSDISLEPSFTNRFDKDWQRVAEHFDTLFTTSASIDTLKQTILQLAVMGKLVKQDPNDEPAAKLLERIAKEKAQLIKEGKIKKQKPLPAITDEEKPFELPNGWEWVRFDDTTLSSSAGWSPQCIPTPRVGDSWGVLKVSAVTWGQFNPEENKELPSHLEPRHEHEVQSGDFLISRANTAELVAKAVVVPDLAPKNLMMSDKIIRFKLHESVNGEYLNLMNNSQVSRDYYNRVAGGTSSSMKNVSREQIRNLVVALPPQEEQQRIVAKVDELMALCDQLKARLADAQTTQLHLTDAIVEKAI
ncbi:restriction endonuclease subunit S [Shewanella baltica]|uniref:restriction endonuclease subunit S n=1 Tax=Shewanella baltica TaxID=62322 RepID=UPI000D375113|nr:restriction endonuclease subunit S [Shewanella baltica]